MFNEFIIIFWVAHSIFLVVLLTTWNQSFYRHIIRKDCDVFISFRPFRRLQICPRWKLRVFITSYLFSQFARTLFHRVRNFFIIWCYWILIILNYKLQILDFVNLIFYRTLGLQKLNFQIMIKFLSGLRPLFDENWFSGWVFSFEVIWSFR